MTDTFHLDRFLDAQNSVFEAVCAELRRGRKESHWMWFIFPQVDGLGSSATARHFAIKSADEARAYLKHPVLGERLRQCAGLLLAHRNLSANKIMGYPDDLKLRSSMTLFGAVAESDPVFQQVLDLFFEGKPEEKTLAILNRAA